ncbi:hypothetical protein BR93DRAFT_995634 [Coniochaeta sp. PMI_546]|nr:hypothetical protein BR93DRAFT_995634 [Coniochaeta sp. PMI_546]
MCQPGRFIMYLETGPSRAVRSVLCSLFCIFLCRHGSAVYEDIPYAFVENIGIPVVVVVSILDQLSFDIRRDGTLDQEHHGGSLPQLLFPELEEVACPVIDHPEEFSGVVGSRKVAPPGRGSCNDEFAHVHGPQGEDEALAPLIEVFETGELWYWRQVNRASTHSD